MPDHGDQLQQPRALEVPQFTVHRGTAAAADELGQAIGTDVLLLHKWFGQDRLVDHLEACFLSLLVRDPRRDNRIVAFASFQDFAYNPAISSPAIEQESWEQWARSTFDVPADTSPLNTLWLRYLYIEDSGSQATVDLVGHRMFDAVYASHPEIDQVLCVIPGGLPSEAITSLCIPVPRLDSSLDAPQLFASVRSRRIPTLEIRIGRVEDHDDLLPFVAPQGKALVDKYGAYYLAELLESQDASNRTLVALADGVPVGVMRLSASDFDVRVLAENFDLAPYGNLVKNGRASAVRIQLFAMDDAYESRVCDFFRPAMDLFPDKEYMILLVPFTTADQQILRLFNPVPQKLYSLYPQDLFLFHRFNTSTNFSVAPAAPQDLLSLQPFVQRTVRNGPAVMKQAHDHLNSVNNTHGQQQLAKAASFVLKCNGVPVGLVNLSHECHTRELRGHFDVEKFVPMDVHEDFEHTELLHFVIDPVFRNRTRFFLRECLRLCSKSVLLCKTERLADFHAAAEEMVPVPPRRTIEAPGRLAHQQSQSMPFCLFVSRRKLLAEPIRFNRSRIVVIGASDTGLSIIHNLLMIPDVKFSNIYLVSPLGMPSMPSLDDEIRFRPYKHTFTPAEYRRFHVPNGLHAVEDKLVDFLRDRKHAVLGSGKAIAYDYLVLATGQQYKLSRRVHPKDKAVPDGVFILRDPAMDVDLGRFIRDDFLRLQDQVEPIAIYGHDLDALCVVQSLLNYGVKPANILLVTPRMNMSDHIQKGLFHERLAEVIATTGIQYMPNHLLKSLVSDGEDGEEELAAIMIQNDDEEERDDMTRAMEGEKLLEDPFEVPCSTLVYMHKSEVDDDILHAVNFRALVFDGRLILKPSFKTEDPCVMAVGSVAKFSRRFGPSEDFELFNAREVATRFTKIFLPEIEPDLFAVDAESEAFPPNFSQPLATSCVVPGGSFLFRAWSPTHYVKTQQILAKNKKEKLANPAMPTVLIPEPRSIHTHVGGNFLQIFFDDRGCVLEVRYLGQSQPLASNWFSMIGLPERYLHNIISRFEEGILPDLVAFLNERWAHAVFHDRFTGFRMEMQRMFLSHDDVQSIMDGLQRMLDGLPANEPVRVSDEDLNSCLKAVHPKSRKFVQKKCIEFLRQQEDVLRVYFLPRSLK